MIRTQIATACFAYFTLSSLVLAQAELPIDKISTDAALESPTSEDFLTRWVDSVPEHPTIPSPRDVWGILSVRREN